MQLHFFQDGSLCIFLRGNEVMDVALTGGLDIQLGALSDCRLRVNFANHLVTDAGQQWGPRTIPDWQFVFLLSGRALLCQGGEQFEIYPGEGVFYGPNSPHTLTASPDEGMTFCSIHFSWQADDLTPVHPAPKICDVSTDALQEPTERYFIRVDSNEWMAVPTVFSTAHLGDVFQQIVREYRSESLGYTLVMQHLLGQLIVGILRNGNRPRTDRAALRRVLPALECIKSHPETPWTIQQLADVCGYHPTYFAELFKLAVGHPPKQHIMNERILYAKTLLTATRTIDEVALKVGCSSVHYFCRQFKRVTGLTPSEYRNRHNEL